jgi:hypothetical protein
MIRNKTQDTDADDWQRAGPYEFVHVTGWTITNRIVNGKSVWALQLGRRTEGNFSSPQGAMGRHAALVQDSG